MLKIYQYKNCGTCRKALKFLDAKGIKYNAIPIRDHPPSMEELKLMLTRYRLKDLFNTSGVAYRERNMKDKLPSLSEEEALGYLANDGNLVKRPFVLGDNLFLVGFKEEEWEEVFS